MLIKQNYIFFSTMDELKPKATFNGNLIKFAESCCCIGIHLDSKAAARAQYVLSFVIERGTCLK